MPVEMGGHQTQLLSMFYCREPVLILKNDPHCFGRKWVFLIRISYDNRREGNMKEGDVVVRINFQLWLNRKRIPFLSLACKDGIFCLLWSFHSPLGILCWTISASHSSKHFFCICFIQLKRKHKIVSSDYQVANVRWC